ncbi:MAG: hypothetical protein QOK16_4323 [Solirubrobacteraceae bacterium]|jgi:hypothetical protein|nr:hypothetical protein [Solirubrobacteraceae bacterium]MEA2189312.1 hypothetical protein [Solirubrobacteraceae bacterium]
MMTTTIIFTLLVALWGHPRAIGVGRKRHDTPTAARDCTAAGPAPPTAANDY